MYNCLHDILYHFYKDTVKVQEDKGFVRVRMNDIASLVLPKELNTYQIMMQATNPVVSALAEKCIDAHGQVSVQFLELQLKKFLEYSRKTLIPKLKSDEEIHVLNGWVMSNLSRDQPNLTRLVESYIQQCGLAEKVTGNVTENASRKKTEKLTEVGAEKYIQDTTQGKNITTEERRVKKAAEIMKKYDVTLGEPVSTPTSRKLCEMIQEKIEDGKSKLSSYEPQTKIPVLPDEFKPDHEFYERTKIKPGQAPIDPPKPNSSINVASNDSPTDSPKNTSNTSNTRTDKTAESTTAKKSDQKLPVTSPHAKKDDGRGLGKRQKALIRQLQLFDDSYEVYMVLPSEDDGSGDERLEILRITGQEEATTIVMVN